MKKDFTRREFTMLSALAGAGLTFGLPAVRGFETFAQGMSASSHGGATVHLAPLAAVGDCARLGVYSPAINANLKAALTAQLDVVQLGGALPNGNTNVPVLLAECRDAKTKDEMTTRKLALATGWLLHDAVHAQFAASEPAKVNATPSEISDRQLYQDVAVLRELNRRETRTMTPTARIEKIAYQPIRNVSVNELDDLFSQIGQRLLLQLHTFEPDAENIDAWLPQLIKWREQQDRLFRRYAEAYGSPDPAKVRQYITAPNFYDQNEPIIRLAGALHSGTAGNRDEFNRAMQSTDARSQYGRAVRTGYNRLRTVSDFLERSVDEQQLKGRLNLEMSRR